MEINEILDQIPAKMKQLEEGIKDGLFSTLPEKGGIRKEMIYLYGFALDVLIVMEYNQRVKVKKDSDARVWNVHFNDLNVRYLPGYTSAIVDCYDVRISAYFEDCVDELLDKYDKMRERYYQKFKKLSNDKKSECDISKFEADDIICCDPKNPDLFNALKKENLKFPPSKAQLIELINHRIMNGYDYETIDLEHIKGIVADEPDLYLPPYKTSFPEPITSWAPLLDVLYYLNLTRNMSIEEVAKFYPLVISDIKNYLNSLYDSFLDANCDLDAKKKEKAINKDCATIQRVFCEIIFLKKGIKSLNLQQKDEVIAIIAETYLDENLKYSVYDYARLNDPEDPNEKKLLRKRVSKYRA